ncbi:hypothetical protein SLEP1_g12889 [Rubroshorea leprosula]|uniref:Uncharacterized protein n=1 Tax=Rubroshorea leprosula TaxID=152421 RepID=A0AAV5IN56_9ROSI|nr:hypothetical protein SLEP1_g12889 [Rubroshorea leprosula]
MRFMKAIPRVEDIRNNIKRLKEARHPENADVVEKVLMDVKEALMVAYQCAMRRCRRKARQELPKWVEKKIDNKLLKIRQDIAALYEPPFKLEEYQNPSHHHVIEKNLDTPSNLNLEEN